MTEIFTVTDNKQRWYIESTKNIKKVQNYGTNIWNEDYRNAQREESG